jgi:hypothetical protein
VTLLALYCTPLSMPALVTGSQKADAVWLVPNNGTSFYCISHWITQDMQWQLVPLQEMCVFFSRCTRNLQDRHSRYTQLWGWALRINKLMRPRPRSFRSGQLRCIPLYPPAHLTRKHFAATLGQIVIADPFIKPPFLGFNASKPPTKGITQPVRSCTWRKKKKKRRITDNKNF